MPRPRNAISVYSVAKGGRAFSGINAGFISFGRDGPDAKLKYPRCWSTLQKGTRVETPQSMSAPAPLWCNELCLAFLSHAPRPYIDRETRKPSTAVGRYQSTLKPLRKLFGETAAGGFGPNRLRRVGKHTSRLADPAGSAQECDSDCHVGREGVSRELVSPAPGGIEVSLGPLRRGKSAEGAAADGDPRGRFGSRQRRLTRQT
jgi:hypothetical protein